MSTNNINNIAYGFTGPLLNVSPEPIISVRMPSTNDKAALGTLWINKITNAAYVLTSIINNSANWEAVGAGPVNSFITDSGTAMPSHNALTVHGAHGLNTTGVDSTVTIAINNNIVLGDLSDISAGNDALTVATGDITLSGTNISGNINLPATTSAGTSGIINSNATPLAYSLNGDPYLGNAGNFNISGNENVAIGNLCMSSATTDTSNVAIGYHCMRVAYENLYNVAIGNGAMDYFTGSNNNVAIGNRAMLGGGSSGGAPYPSAFDNTCVGAGAGGSLLGNLYNTMVGSTAGSEVSSDNNTLIGYLAGNNYYNGTEVYNIVLGSGIPGTPGVTNTTIIGQTTGADQQIACYIGGISGVTVTGTAVLCSTSGQLGTVSSSMRFKENIEDISIKSEAIFDLRPVMFNYKDDKSQHRHYGLIAEEVEEDFPDLIVYDEGDKPFSVSYHELPALLLNELKKTNARIAELEKMLSQVQ